MIKKSWDEYKVRKLTKQDFKLFNKAVAYVENEDSPWKYRDTLKWSIIAILDELVEIEEGVDNIKLTKEFDKIMSKDSKQPIVLAPLNKIENNPCTMLDKDHTFKLIS